MSIRLQERISLLRLDYEKDLRKQAYTSEEAWGWAVCSPEGRDLVRAYYKARGGIQNISGHVAKMTWRWEHERGRPTEWEDILTHMGYRRVGDTNWFIEIQ